jgi:N-acetylglucosaminyldiphosphoundecaprenol N-acetyl-beta-D-mannosaminyltransferase
VVAGEIGEVRYFGNGTVAILRGRIAKEVHMTEPGTKIRQLFGMPIHAVTMSEAVAAAEDAITRRHRLLVGVVNAAKIVNMRRDLALRDAVLNADMIVADGMSVVWASWLLRRPLPERVAGIDLMSRLLERGSERGYRVFLFGAHDDVLKTVAARIASDYPGILLVGQRNGYYAAGEEAGIADEIAAARPDMLFVAMSPPKKEMFLGAWADRMGVPVCHGVGGAFDVVAGKVKRAPGVFQALGMEWLYRVLQEPRRLWTRYLVTNTLFCGLVVQELLQALFGVPAARRGA